MLDFKCVVILKENGNWNFDWKEDVLFLSCYLLILDWNFI